MRIGIMGSGGLGGYFGARLAQAARTSISSPAAATWTPCAATACASRAGAAASPAVQATDEPAEVGVADFVLLGVKLWDTEQAIEQIRPHGGTAHDRHLVPERRVEGPLPARRIRCAPAHGRRRLCRHDDRGARASSGRPARCSACCSASSTARGPSAARRCWPPAWRAASRPSCPTTSCARSGRNMCSWSACRGPRPRCAAHRPDPLEPADARLPARRDAGSDRGRPRARRRPAGRPARCGWSARTTWRPR